MVPTPSGRLYQHEIDEGKGADEGEQNAKADGETRAQGRVLEMPSTSPAAAA